MTSQVSARDAAAITQEPRRIPRTDKSMAAIFAINLPIRGRRFPFTNGEWLSWLFRLFTRRNTKVTVGAVLTLHLAAQVKKLLAKQFSPNQSRMQPQPPTHRMAVVKGSKQIVLLA